MRNVTTYDSLTNPELRTELVAVTSALAAATEDLGMHMADYYRDFLEDYARSPGTSVAGKNREAQYANQETAKWVIQHRAKINSLTLCRDLLIFMLLSNTPGTLPFPGVANEDENGMAVL